MKRAEVNVLQQLLGNASVAEFFERHYTKLPLARRGGADTLVTDPWQLIAVLLQDDTSDVLIGRESTQWSGDRPRDIVALRVILAEGYTLGVRHAERNDVGLKLLADRFSAAFAAPVDIHVYCTPAAQPGFGWHYDAEEVFVLQLCGEKEWWLRKNTVHPWPLLEAMPSDQHFEREIMPGLSCQLTAGDWLYIPSGYWHRTQAGSESVSLSVGLRAPVAIDVVDLLRPHLMASLLWRQRLPCTGTATETSDAELIEQLRTMAAMLAADFQQQLTSEVVLGEWIAALRVARSGC